MGKTLLWPLYKLLSSYREYDSNGKLRYRKAQAKLNSDARYSIMEWYTRINTCGIYKKFYTCLGAHATTKVGLWCGRATKRCWDGKKSSKGWRSIPGTKEIKIVSTWGEDSSNLNSGLQECEGMTLGQQRVALAISLILKLLGNHASECGDIIVIHTNIGALARYIEKDCYPGGLRRRQYLESILIHRLLCKPQAGSTGENRMMHPRQLKSCFIA